MPDRELSQIMELLDDLKVLDLETHPNSLIGRCARALRYLVGRHGEAMDAGRSCDTSLPHISGALGMQSGDWVRYTVDGRTGIAMEFLQDGDAYVMWNDGTTGCVKWHNLVIASRQMHLSPQ